MKTIVNTPRSNHHTVEFTSMVPSDYFVQGSGRIADILAYAYQNAEEVAVESEDEDGKKKLNRFSADEVDKLACAPTRLTCLFIPIILS